MTKSVNTKSKTLAALTQLDKALEGVLNIMNNPYDKTINNLDSATELTDARANVQGLIDDLEDEAAPAAGK